MSWPLGAQGALCQGEEACRAPLYIEFIELRMCVSAGIFVFTRSVISTKKTASNLGISGPDSETHTVPPAIESFIVSTRES